MIRTNMESLSKPLSYHCNITTTLYGFSSCDGDHRTSKEFKGDDIAFSNCFGVMFYADGNCIENKGYVSIIFNHEFDVKQFGLPETFSCTASVIDASGYKRFPQSFAVHHGFGSEDNTFFLSEGFGFGRYLKRSTLLSDPSELLPEDSLSLLLEIDFVHERSLGRLIPKYHDIHDDMVTENCNWYLRLDTTFARDLCKMSSVFQRMMETDMAEKRTGKVLIPFEEELIFFLLYEILSKAYAKLTLPLICRMYVVADKYDMQPIIQLCHQLLISVMREITTVKRLKYIAEEVHVLSKLTDRFGDDTRLKDILTIYSDIKNELEKGTDDLIASIAHGPDTEWRCVFEEISEETYSLAFLKWSVNRS